MKKWMLVAASLLTGCAQMVEDQTSGYSDNRCGAPIARNTQTTLDGDAVTRILELGLAAGSGATLPSRATREARPAVVEGKHYACPDGRSCAFYTQTEDTLTCITIH